MTKVFALVSPDGQCLQRTTLDMAPLGPPLNGGAYVEISEDLDVATVYFMGDEAIPLPHKMNPVHTFDFKSKSWVDRRTTSSEWEKVRDVRNALLSKTDFTQCADSPVDKKAWAVYRSALRNITQQQDPFSIVWPTKPG